MKYCKPINMKLIVINTMDVDRLIREKNPNVFKIVVGGEGGSGKTTLLTTIMTNCFNERTDITIGCDCKIMKYNIDGIPLTFQFWDLGGQPRFQFIHPSLMRGTKGAILLLDNSKLLDSEKLSDWLDLIYNHNPDVPIILVGTKSDLGISFEMQELEAVIENIKKKAGRDYNITGIHCVSSKQKENITTPFDNLARILATPMTPFIQ